MKTLSTIKLGETARNGYAALRRLALWEHFIKDN